MCDYMSIIIAAGCVGVMITSLLLLLTVILDRK